VQLSGQLDKTDIPADNRKDNMKIFGTSTIHPALFYPAKALGILLVFLMMLSLAGYSPLMPFPSDLSFYTGILFFISGMVMGGLSLLNLGSSTRMGLPEESTSLKTGGLYRYSRNPMYLGLNLAILGSMVYFLHLLVIAAGLFSIVTHHFIILREERFLEERFGVAYRSYRKRTARYL
jgi:protein-S-isoprenylcysteine O-methyltransferase Ste14